MDIRIRKLWEIWHQLQEACGLITWKLKGWLSIGIIARPWKIFSQMKYVIYDDQIWRQVYIYSKSTKEFLSISFAYYSSQYVRSLEPLKDRWSEELVKIGKMVSAGSGTLKTGFSCITSNLKVRTLTLKWYLKILI